MIITDAHVIGPWVCARAGGEWNPGRGTAIGLMSNGELIAGVLYEDWNRANIVCHIAGSGNWANRRFLNVIFDYPFNYLGVRRITCPVDSRNAKCVDLMRSMGFIIEAKLEKATPLGDLLLFRMFKEDCKFIKGRYLPKGNENGKIEQPSTRS